MVKIIGAALILFCCTWTAHEYRTGLKKGISHLEVFVNLIDHIRIQIDYFSIPLPQILNEYEKIALKSSGEILLSLKEDALLSNDEKKILTELFLHLGDGYKDEQIKLCSYANEQLKRYLEKRTREYPEKVKVNNSLCFLAGASAILILI